MIFRITQIPFILRYNFQYPFSLDELDDFILNINSEVDASNKYNSYEQLDSAVMSCRNDSECVGIYDEGCDSRGPFLHIRRGFMRSENDPHCVHKKKRYEGK